MASKLQTSSSSVLSLSTVKSLTLGFLLYFIAVIVADLYGGSGVVFAYYAGILFICMNVIPKCFNHRIVPVELVLYLLLIVFTEYKNGQWSIYYFESLLQLASVVVLAAYLTTTRRIRFFTYGLSLALVFSCIYFLMFATNSVLKITESEIRHALPFFSVSSAGLMTALGYFLGLVNFFGKKQPVWLLLSALCLATCLYTLSKNALLAIIIITVIYLIIVGVIRFNKTLLIVIGIVLVAAVIAGDMLRPILQLYSEAIDTSGSSGMVSIAGRGGIWLFCAQSIAESPWIGQGYYSASELLTSNLGEEISQAHNCLLHNLLSTGIIGTLLLTVYLVRLIVFIKKNIRIILRSTYMRWILCMLMYFMIRGLTEASYAQCSSLDVFWYFMLSLVMMQYVSRSKKVYRIMRRPKPLHKYPELNEDTAG